VVLLASIKLLSVPLTKPLPLIEYSQVAPTSKLLTVITPLLVMFSKLTQGDYTVTVNLSGDRNGVNVTGLNSITTAVDIVKPAQPTFDFVDTGLDNDNITNNGVITV
jgi:hypothetical protein